MKITSIFYQEFGIVNTSLYSSRCTKLNNFVYNLNLIAFLIVTNKVLGHYLCCLLLFFHHVNSMQIPIIKKNFGAKPLWIVFTSICGIHLAFIHGDTWMKTHWGGTTLSMLEVHNKGKLTLWKQDPTWHERQQKIFF